MIEPRQVSYRSRKPVIMYFVAQIIKWWFKNKPGRSRSNLTKFHGYGWCYPEISYATKDKKKSNFLKQFKFTHGWKKPYKWNLRKWKNEFFKGKQGNAKEKNTQSPWNVPKYIFFLFQQIFEHIYTILLHLELRQLQ